MPNRPTKEYWQKINGHKSPALKGYIWHHKIKAKTKKKYETIRRKREHSLFKENPGYGIIKDLMG